MCTPSWAEADDPNHLQTLLAWLEATVVGDF